MGCLVCYWPLGQVIYCEQSIGYATRPTEAHPAAAANISANARAHVLKTLGASAASERRVVMAVLRGYRQALACVQSAGGARGSLLCILLT